MTTIATPARQPTLLARATPALRVLLACLMTAVGIVHFVNPAPFVKIVPSALPAPLALVYVSGFFEIAGGVGLLVPRVQRLAAWGLVALYVAVFPANVNMAVNHISFDDAHPFPTAALWGRLPLQIVLVAWAWWLARDARDRAARPPTR